MPLCFVKDRFLDSGAPALRASERAVRFADGAFETVRLIAGKPYQWGLHKARLARGAQALRLTLPSLDMTEIAQELVRRAGVKAGFLRLSLSRGAGGAGYLPDPEAPAFWIAELLPERALPALPARLAWSRYRRPRGTGMAEGIKTSQGQLSTLARLEAASCDDAVLLDTSGFLSETSGANLFWQKGERLFTPSLACAAVEGTTRAAFQRLSGRAAEEGEYAPAALAEADAAWITSVAQGIRPVASLEGRHWEVGEAQWQWQRRLEEDYARASGW